MDYEIVSGREEWDKLVQDGGGHPLQLWGWGELKSRHGWNARRIKVVNDKKVVGAAQILTKKLPKPFGALCYVPRGPVMIGDEGPVLSTLEKYAKDKGAVAIKIEPEWPTTTPLPAGWKKTKNRILMSHTLVLDLTRDLDDLMGEVAKKTRQYIRKSGKEVFVREAKDIAEIDKCLDIYKDTAKRAGFDLHGDDYYKDLYELMRENSPVYVAENSGEIVAFLWMAESEKTAFELYGGMNEDGQRLRANYALKWQVIEMMKERGVERYDMNGLLNDGVSGFKMSFANHTTDFIGSLDCPTSVFYQVWDKGLPLGKKIMRRVRKS